MLDNYIEIKYALAVNQLPFETRAKIIGMLVEGKSLRATSRLCDVSINTVTKLLLEVADGAAKYHDENIKNVHVRRLKCDEIWCFVGAKNKKRTVRPQQEALGWGDVWTWTAIDVDTKLCVSYLVGGRDVGWAMDFMHDCAKRISGRVQVTTDGHRPYLDAVEGAFGMDVDYAQLQKIYGRSDRCRTAPLQPAQCIGADMNVVSGNPDLDHVSTSFVERQNLTMRMGMRRVTRLTNGSSKKVENRAAAVALHFIHYNFARIHKNLRITPAMAAGIADHVWSLEEIALLAN